MRLHFTKMHGAGNDYIYVDCISHSQTPPSGGWGAVSVRLSDRHFGIGADGLVLILPSEVADLRMRMFNADGSEAQMCGNAARCVARYAYDHKLVNSTTFTLETLAGVKTIAPLLSPPQGGSCLATSNILFSVDMGEPVIIEKDLTQLGVRDAMYGVSTEAHTGMARVIDNKRDAINGVSTLYAGSQLCVSMGNPHAVFFVDKVDEVDVHGLGRAIECDPLFPERTNVEFVEVISPTEVRIRVWERGSGETLACGTGACAVCVAGATLGLTSRNITLHLLGGDLHVRWQESDNHVILTGPAEYAFAGEVCI